MSVMTEAPAATDLTMTPAMTPASEAEATVGAVISCQQDAETAEDAMGEDAMGELAAATADRVTEPIVEGAPEVVPAVVPEPIAEAAEDKSKAKRPRKSAPRKAAGTKALVLQG